MLKHILPLIPNHKVYVEPFFGGGAVFFAKEPSETEIINDIDDMVINFYQVLKTNFSELRAKIEATLFSRAVYKVALVMYRHPILFTKLQLAWAFYILTNCGFACQIGSWGYDRNGKRPKYFANKKDSFSNDFAKRLKEVEIEHNDACKVIQSRDSENAFHYCDPPYIETNQAHYKGYTREHYRALLETLTHIKGKFLLSSFPNDLLNEYVRKNNWHIKSFDKPSSASNGARTTKRKRKTELLVANYEI